MREKYIALEKAYNVFPLDFIQNILTSHATVPKNYLNFIFTFTHITTSSNKCASIKQYGILDLVQSDSLCNSDLYQFLAERNISIDLTNKILTYNTQSFDISPNTRNPACLAICNKFFYDYGVNGFLSMSNKPYAGNVHLRPEILLNIDKLLYTTLCDEWEETHPAYEITVAIAEEKNLIVNTDSEEIFFDYIIKTYYNAFHSLSEEQIHIKRGQSIETSEIKTIQKLQHWL